MSDEEIATMLLHGVLMHHDRSTLHDSSVAPFGGQAPILCRSATILPR